jgi:thiamine biosynthesis protein ThiS
VISVAGKQFPWREGMTIADLLGEMEDSNSYAVVRVNDRYVSRPDFDKTVIPDDAEVLLIPMISGG